MCGGYEVILHVDDSLPAEYEYEFAQSGVETVVADSIDCIVINFFNLVYYSN